MENVEYIDLPIITSMKTDFIHSYNSTHKKRKLKFKQIGTVKLQYTTLDGRSSLHIVTPLQATALMTIVQHEKGILFTDLQKKLGTNEITTTQAIEIWLEKGIITASDFMGSLLFQIV